MENRCVHFMALDTAKRRLAETEAEYHDASARLDEALKMGDLRENSEYEAARSTVQRIAMERDQLMPVLMYPVVRANDNISMIEEGSIVHIRVWSVTPSPVAAGSREFEEIKQHAPVFDGVLMFGGTLEYQELLKDNALSCDTPIGAFLLSKHPGDYSIQVPGGFANVTVEKLPASTHEEDLYVKYDT